MKLLRRPSCVSRLMLRARCRCAPRAERAKIIADGSATGNDAGWGFVVVSDGTEIGRDRGPVVTVATHPRWCGAGTGPG
eukprot:5641004-Prymnesium_polylepis.1